MTFDLNEAAKNLHDLQKAGEAMGLHARASSEGGGLAANPGAPAPESTGGPQKVRRWANTGPEGEMQEHPLGEFVLLRDVSEPHLGLGSGALRERLCERITSYLTLGGLFNAELMNHDAVRELLSDCRVGLSLSSPIEPPRPARTVGCTASDDCVHECPVSEPESRLDEFKTTVIALWDPELTPEQKKAYIASRGKELREAAALAPSRQGAGGK